ncbi:Capsid polyprotein [Actinidia chinensis var. chinensis]|uniref:Capsid polyprotein n=1 Tax=Actinidia chinensis var. chinensis TaxID=1590841 RepID=A0A2R6RME9_ACTCC|nr:Capsid polyprotein [Actinidia chinensis var. chinensis]
MSKMRSDLKPPLPRSPTRLPPRRVLRSNSNNTQTPPGSLTKTQLPNRPQDTEESELRPEYRTISCELRALAKMVEDEFGNADSGNVGFGITSGVVSNPMFERGRFYDEYSARRNERLKRKKGETGNEKKSLYDLGVKVESAKRRDSKRIDGLRKSVYSTPVMADQRENPRYLLRSMTKENKKPPLPVTFVKSVAHSDRKTAVRRVRKS